MQGTSGQTQSSLTLDTGQRVTVTDMLCPLSRVTLLQFDPTVGPHSEQTSRRESPAAACQSCTHRKGLERTIDPDTNFLCTRLYRQLVDDPDPKTGSPTSECKCKCKCQVRSSQGFLQTKEWFARARSSVVRTAISLDSYTPLANSCIYLTTLKAVGTVRHIHNLQPLHLDHRVDTDDWLGHGRERGLVERAARP
ncbi:hypothetical protein BJY01DRAFT_229137 [Aspergillus pseudoustus]|uniref:Uncharacterized protein n=1 Tax=Aspergillus pseudoustus TaxID=1810923 RepID=A0ABR4IHR3_9EURO